MLASSVNNEAKASDLPSGATSPWISPPFGVWKLSMPVHRRCSRRSVKASVTRQYLAGRRREDPTGAVGHGHVLSQLL